MVERGTEGIRTSVDNGIALLTIDVPGQSANTMSASFKAELRVVVERLAHDQSLRGVIITSAKKTFFAGGDLRNLIAVRPEDAQSFFDGLEAFKRTLRSLERLPIPVTVAINGAALGGGWEICLCAHARFCLDDARILLGLPEATLGLLPGAGGVNRMTRLLGLERALPYLLDGRTFTPSQARDMGLLHGTAPDMPSVIALAQAWIAANPHPRVPWDEPGFEAPGLRRDLAQVCERAPLEALLRDHGRDPARQAILGAAVEGACVDIDTALRIETRYLTRLATQQVAKNMIQTFFFEANELKGGKGRPALPRTEFKRLALDAALPRADALAQAFAAKHITVTLFAREGKALDDARSRFTARLDAAVQQGRLTRARADAAAALIELRVGPAPLDTDAVLHVCAVDAPERLACVCSRPGSTPTHAAPGTWAGLRFVPEVEGPLVEVVHSASSAPEGVALAYDLVQALGKTPILVQDSSAGYVGRLVGAARREVEALRDLGASDALIENASEQTGLAQGPLALAAQFGLKLRGGRRGPAQPSVRDIQDRMLFVMALEAARCFEQGIVASVREANIGSILGVGFPRWTGGALQYIHQYGLGRFVVRAEELAVDGGARFAPGAQLRALAARGAQRLDAEEAA